MLHGSNDPHPGALIRDSLAAAISKLGYVELPRCGHYPWLESEARDGFLAALENCIRST